MAVVKRAYDCRLAFVREAKLPSSAYCENTLAAYIEAAGENESNYNPSAWHKLKKLLGDKKIESPKDLLKKYRNRPQDILFLLAYAEMGDNKETGFVELSYARGADRKVRWKDNIALTKIYTFLRNNGYEMSDEELALQNGTHEIFKEDKEK